MKTVLLCMCVAFVAFVAADDHREKCTPLAKFKVKAQWAAVYGSSASTREAFGREVWDYVFEHAPEAKKLFSRVRGDNIFSSEFSAHSVRVLGGLDMAVSLLHDEDTLTAQLSHLHIQHVERNIPAEYFDMLERALLHAIPLHTAHFDQDAWHACFHNIADPIIGSSE